MQHPSFALVFVGFLTLGSAFAERRVIHPRQFPQGRPFSPGILEHSTLYVSGQIGQDLRTGKIPEDFEEEVRQCLRNVEAVLTEARMSAKDVVSVQVYLRDMALFDRMNAVYTKFFGEPRPARTTVGVAGLVGTARIEITVTAHNDRAGFSPGRAHP